jgi:hypothetical protein
MLIASPPRLFLTFSLHSKDCLSLISPNISLSRNILFSEHFSSTCLMFVILGLHKWNHQNMETFLLHSINSLFLNCPTSYPEKNLFISNKVFLHLQTYVGLLFCSRLAHQGTCFYKNGNNNNIWVQILLLQTSKISLLHPYFLSIWKFFYQVYIISAVNMIMLHIQQFRATFKMLPASAENEVVVDFNIT